MGRLKSGEGMLVCHRHLWRDEMRLLAVVEYFPPVLGHDLRIYELARRLPADWEVRFLVVPSLRRLMIRNGTDHAGSVTEERVLPIPVALPAWIERWWKVNWIAAYLLTFPVVFVRAAKAAGRTRPEIILANYPSPYTGLLAYFLSRLRSVPYVVDFCDDIVAYFETIFPRESPGFMNRAARRVQDFLIRRSAVLPVVTRSLRDYAIARGVDRRRIEVLANGADLSLFSEPTARSANGPVPRPGAGFVCFYGGSLESWAGSAMLVDLARCAERDGTGIELAVAGNALPEANPALPRSLHHLGFLDKQGVVEALSRSDCVLVPLQAGMVADATSPVKLFEGLAAGKPCLCSRVAGIGDVIEDGRNGILIDSLNPETWLERIRDLKGDTALQAHLAEEAKATAVRYDWTRLADRYSALLRRPLEAR